MIDHEAHIDAQLDHLVDTRQMSYTEAYAHLGLEAPAAEEVSAAALHEATGNVALTGAETIVDLDDPTADFEPSVPTDDWKPGDPYKFEHGFDIARLQKLTPKEQSDHIARWRQVIAQAGDENDAQRKQ